MNREKCEGEECEALKDLKITVSKHEKQLAHGETQFAVINTKLNIVMGIMGTIGASLCAIVIKIMIGV